MSIGNDFRLYSVNNSEKSAVKAGILKEGGRYIIAIRKGEGSLKDMTIDSNVLNGFEE